MEVLSDNKTHDVPRLLALALALLSRSLSHYGMRTGELTGVTGGDAWSTRRSHSTPQHFTRLHLLDSTCLITSANALAEMVMRPPSDTYSVGVMAEG